MPFLRIYSTKLSSFQLIRWLLRFLWKYGALGQKRSWLVARSGRLFDEVPG